MVRLRVVDHEIIDVRGVRYLPDIFEIFLKKTGVDRFDQGRFFALHEIGVIGGAVFGGHDNIEGAQRRVHHPDRIHAFLQFDCCHR